MPFIPHTQQDVAQMLDAIGVQEISDLFREIPVELKTSLRDTIPVGVNEQQITRLMTARAAQDGQPLCFIGAGAYEHHIPAAVWEITTRGEFYTAYTPYQAEASQGTLQLLYEYQSMMAGLNAMEVSNASLYDGASALAEAVLMAIRANHDVQVKRVLIPRSVHPNYRKTVTAIVSNQKIEIVEVPFDKESGCVDKKMLEAYTDEFSALVIAQPNFFGQLEDVDVLTQWAHTRKALVIAVVNPTTLAVLKPPGQWGDTGADISCGEGQPLGIPLASGGPYYGFLCAKQSLVRQMPGRIIGRTVDLNGKMGFTLTLQAREQHIRRSKATSNICTNQGLMVTASTIYMSMLGAEGLARVASESFYNTHTLTEQMQQLPAVSRKFSGDYFHEAVLCFDASIEVVQRAMAAQNIIAGYYLGDDYPELGDCMLVCATETKTAEDITTYMMHIQRILSKQTQIKCPIQPKM